MNTTTDEVPAGTQNAHRLLTGLRRQWWVIVVCVALAAVGAVADIKLTKPSYKASAVTTIANPSASTQTTNSQGVTTGPAGPSPYTELGSTSVTKAAASAAHLDVTDVKLAGSENLTNNTFVVTATASTRVQAAAAANAAATEMAAVRVADLNSSAAALNGSLRSLGSEIQTLQREGGSLSASGQTVTSGNVQASTKLAVATADYESLYQQQQNLIMEASYVTVTGQAQPYTAALVIDKKKIVELALLAGLLAGIGIALLRDRLDDRIRSTGELSEIGSLDVLARIPTSRTAGLTGTMADNPSHGLAESVRELRTALRFLAVKRPLQTILVTSPTPGDGKSFVAANLAMAWAMSGVRTVLVSCDLRRPTLDGLFGIDRSQPGLSEAIVDPSLLEDVDKLLVPTPVQGLAVLAAGATPPNSAELLGSDEFATILGRLQEVADVIVLDTPAVLAVTDALVLTAQADGLLLVTAEGRTSRAAARRALKSLHSGLAPVLGVVANFASTSDVVGYGNGSGGRGLRRWSKLEAPAAPAAIRSGSPSRRPARLPTGQRQHGVLLSPS